MEVTVSISSTDLKLIITDPNGAQVLVTNANEIGAKLYAMRMSTSQIRALFGEVRQIQAQWNMEGAENRQKALRRLVLLKPKMAYRARKENNRGVQELVDVLNPALDEVLQEKNPRRQSDHFQRFVEFFEAILAYHKAAGGS
jgi:CRISPR-associated protein Csm2